MADNELPGGSVGCDVCGVLLDAAQVAVHEALHHAEQEWFEGLTRAVRELTDLVRGSRN